MSKINYSLTQIEYVLALHQFGHFARAAQHCYVTQPTLSMQIQKLEEMLGVIIFDRSKKPLKLTTEGEAIIEQMRMAYVEAKKVETILEHLKSGDLSGELKVGVIPTIAPYVLPKALKIFSQKLPKVTLRFYELQTSQIIEQLRNDRLDVGLLAIPIDGVTFRSIHLYYEPFYVYAAKDHPLFKMDKVAHSKLTTSDIWLLEEGHCLRGQILDICQSAKLSDNLRTTFFESGSLETIRNLVKNLGGYTLMPALAIESLKLTGLVRPVVSPMPSREVGLIYLRDHFKLKLIQSLAEIIKQSLPEEFKDISKKGLDIIPVELGD